MVSTLSLGLLILRLVAGLTLAAHGAQKLFGWFDGPGSYSLDAFFAIALPETLLFCVLAVAALLIDIIGLIISRPAATSATGVKANAS